MHQNDRRHEIRRRKQEIKALRAAQRKQQEALMRLGLALTSGPPGKKHPYKGGYENACTDPRTLRFFGTQDTTLVVCDLSGDHGAVVIDLDCKPGTGIDGEKNFRELCSEAGIELPPTLKIRTNNGVHFYFWQPAANPIRSSVGKLGQGIDVRGIRGVACAPPTPGYRIIADAPVAELPDDLHSILSVSVPPTRTITTTGGAAEHSLGGILAELHNAVEGERNNTLHWVACRVFEMPARKHNTWLWNVRTAARDIGLPDWEIEQTIKSARGAV